MKQILIFLTASLLLFSCASQKKTQGGIPISIGGQQADMTTITLKHDYIAQAKQLAITVTFSQAVSQDETVVLTFETDSYSSGNVAVTIPKGQTVGYYHVAMQAAPAYVSFKVLSVTPNPNGFIVQ